MDITRFEKFEQTCIEGFPKEIDNILKAASGKNFCAIGCITTDDFYGCYLSWDYSCDIEEYYDWEHGINPDFLYQPLVNIVEACKEIDFCEPSEEKREFALAFLAVLDKAIKQIPNEIFQQNHFEREDILFFSTMSDGDYMQEMLDTSVRMFNNPETLKAYGLIHGD